MHTAAAPSDYSGILVDHQIRQLVKSKELKISNFSEKCLEPASYDLRIDNIIYSPSSPNPERPINLKETGGMFRIPAYGSAVLQTMESLEMPATIIGRFGLKSGFARKGLLASTGPQVDPGFKGKLFVTLWNFTPASHILEYEDTFLSIEFHRLRETPDKTYNGPYQGRTDINKEILDDMVRLEGVNLAQMQSQFTDFTRHFTEWSDLAKRIDHFLVSMDRHTEAILKLTDGSPSPAGDNAMIEARNISIAEAKQEIADLFRKRGTLYYSDIASVLHLPYATVISACAELQKEGLIEGAS